MTGHIAIAYNMLILFMYTYVVYVYTVCIATCI